MSDPVSVLIADDHDVVRAGIRAALRADGDFVVIGEARDGLEALQRAQALRPGLVLMDVRMPRLSGIEACRAIRDGLPTNVLILTSYGDEKAVLAAILAGAGGFVLKDIQRTHLLEAMRVVGRGGSLLDAESATLVVRHVLADNLASRAPLARRLTEHQLHIVDLIGNAMTNREIGETMHLTDAMVKQDVGDILSKLGFTSQGGRLRERS